MDVNLVKNALKNDEQVWIFKIREKQTTHILLVEDMPILQTFTQHLLQALGCSVTLAKDGKTVQQYVKEKRKFDLVLMDIQLPDIDGITLTQYLREREVKTPIVALTSEDKSIKTDCIEAGMNDFIQKPATHEKLTLVLQKWGCL